MAWNDNKDDGPWGGRESGNSPWDKPKRPGQESGFDIGDQFDDFVQNVSRFFGLGSKRSGGSGGGKGSMGLPGLIGGVVVAGLVWASSGIVIVDAGQQAVVMRFGKWVTNYGSGFHIHLPVPIETHELIDVEKRRETVVGFINDGRKTAIPAESLMLTGDENIADIRFSVFWKIKTQSPQDYVLNINRADLAVKAVAESVMREVVGRRDLDPIISADREIIQSEVIEKMQSILDSYQAGVDLLSVQIDVADAPPQVLDAFLDLVNAASDKEATINKATRYENDRVPKARGEAKGIIQQAEGYREQVIADAKGQAARFDLIYEEYRKAPRVTRERMFYETMEKVLGRSDKLILESDVGAVPYLPLDRLSQKQDQSREGR